jgi:drug/metabolite transporter (DMT)-like permease
MTSLRHFSWFLALGLFWGLSPSLYKHLADVRIPVLHTVVITGLGVGLAMFLIARWRGVRVLADRAVIVYAVVCAFLLNVPFGLNLYLAAHVPPTELAIIITASPFFNYAIALLTGWESAQPRKLAAITVGFVSTLVLILSREGMFTGDISWWLMASISIPLLYCFYNNYAAQCWPKQADTLVVGAWESLWSGALALPLLLVVAPFGAEGQAPTVAYWILGAAIAMWIVERIAYFTLISEKGAVYTVQATYVSTPAAVIFAAVFFGGAADPWLWISLGILMVAIYLNNSGPPVALSTATLSDATRPSV